MNKFPVISNNGNEYEVIIKDAGYDYVWSVHLIKHEICKLLGFSIKRETVLLEKYFGLKEHKYCFTDVEYLSQLDFVEMANMIVAEYESSQAQSIAYKNTLKQAEQSFSLWDGRCKN